MELNSVSSCIANVISSNTDFVRTCDYIKIIGYRRYSVAVRHPYLRIARYIGEERIRVVYMMQVRPAVFTDRGSDHFTPGVLGHILRTVANPQHRELRL